MTLVEELAQLLYSEDTMAPWGNAAREERDYYYRLADVMVDAMTTHLENKDANFSGALRVSIDYLKSESDLARLRRELV